MAQEKLYFSAGPAMMPEAVKLQIRDELLNYKDCGISVMEMSHRSETFNNIITSAEEDLRKLLNVPDNYAILFMHGGAKMQFAAVPHNLCRGESDKTNYLINGSWSKMAASEAEDFSTVTKQLTKPDDKFTRTPHKDEIQQVVGAKYMYYCDNETIEGVEFNYVPEVSGDCVLVSDMTSNFLSKPVDVTKFGLIFAGTQKNAGTAGLAIVIVRKDLMGKLDNRKYKLLNYQLMHEHRSLYNTPPTWPIYVAGLCFKWIIEQGGLEEMDKFSKKKSNLLYDFLDNSDGFYTNQVDKSSRSRMNVVWLLRDSHLDKKFLEEAKSTNLFDIKGHRSVGGFRASLYHGITIEMVERLISFMAKFKAENSSERLF